QDFVRRQAEGGRQVLEPRGRGHFRIRYCPVQTGWYRYRTFIRLAGKPLQTIGAGRFRCVEGDAGGFVQVEDKPHRPGMARYLKLSDGSPFFVIGQNMAWAGTGRSPDFDKWIDNLADHGGNTIRLFVTAGNHDGLERVYDDGGPRTSSLGRYDQRYAWMIDHLMRTCRRRGVRAIVSLYNFWDLRQTMTFGGQEHRPFADSPYNRANGGPLVRPESFFTDAEAARLQRRLVRYVVARWGADRSVMSWELFNEVDLAPQDSRQQVVQWHRRLAAELKRLDRHGRPITTSGSGDIDDLAALEGIDLVQSHVYNHRDMAGAIAREVAGKLRLGKVHLVSEFSASNEWLGDAMKQDPTGLHLHNGLWAAAMSGSAGGGMSWWWDTYIEPNDLYGHYRGLSRFVEGVPFHTAGFEPVTFEITPRKKVAIHAFVHGRQAGTYGGGPVLKLTLAKAGSISFFVHRVSHGAKLHVSVDDRRVLSEELPAGPGDGPWRKSEQKEDGRWEAVYDRELTVKLPAGGHVVRLDNTGRDWAWISAVTVTGLTEAGRSACLPTDDQWGVIAHRYLEITPEGTVLTWGHPQLRAMGLRSTRRCLAWVQNYGNTWYRRRGGAKPPRGADGTLHVEGLLSGRYRVEHVDTMDGDVLRRHVVTVGADGRLALELPMVATDLGIRLRYVGR
ncbi:MAG: hypothetical protein ACOCXX_03930, partial [Planctomycetota bacterium]